MKVRQVWMWEVDGEQFPETASRFPGEATARLQQMLTRDCDAGEAADFLLRGRFVLVTLGEKPAAERQGDSKGENG